LSLDRTSAFTAWPLPSACFTTQPPIPPEAPITVSTFGILTAATAAPP
jgi:hypothetical protein